MSVAISLIEFHVSSTIVVSVRLSTHDLHKTFENQLTKIYPRLVNQLANVSFYVDYVGLNNEECIANIFPNDANGEVAELKETRAPGEMMKGYWSTSHQVYFFGSGISTLRNKRVLVSEWKHDSKHPICTSVNSIKAAILALESVSSKKTASYVDPFCIVVPACDSEAIDSISDGNLPLLIGHDNIFVNYIQTSYSKLNYTALDSFLTPQVQRRRPKYLLQDLKHSSDAAAFQQTCVAAVQRMKSEFEDWDHRINQAVTELVDWATVIPTQCGYNESTRRLVINVLAKQACLLLGRPIYVEATQCVGMKPPAHYMGSGPLDVVLGGPAVIHSISDIPADPNSDESDSGDSDDDGDDEQQLTSTSESGKCAGRTVVEIKVPKTHNNDALIQLSGECYDHAFVSEALQQRIADLSGSAFEPPPTLEEFVIKKRSISEVPEPSPQGSVKRAFHSITGILSTGNTWDFFTYKTETLDVLEKPKLIFLGTLLLRALTYKQTPMDRNIPGKKSASDSEVKEQATSAIFTGKMASNDSGFEGQTGMDATSGRMSPPSGPRGSGASIKGVVARTDVENIVAMLVLSMKGEL